MSIDNWYETPDPWGYQTNPDDLHRKERILSAIPDREYRKALDIGAGEGWITKDLPAREVYGFEMSDVAASRFPENVNRIIGIGDKTFDLVVATGVLYPHYDGQALLELVRRAATGIILLCHINEWVIDTSVLGEPLHEEVFTYRDYTQKLTVYDVSTS